MNRNEAKKLVSNLHYLSAVAEGAFLTSIADGLTKEERLIAVSKALDESCDVISEAIKGLSAIGAEFDVLNQEVVREASERGRQWTEERAEKIALLRLAGDTTPEENIPL